MFVHVMSTNPIVIKSIIQMQKKNEYKYVVLLLNIISNFHPENPNFSGIFSTQLGKFGKSLSYNE